MFVITFLLLCAETLHSIKMFWWLKSDLFIEKKVESLNFIRVRLWKGLFSTHMIVTKFNFKNERKNRTLHNFYQRKFSDLLIIKCRNKSASIQVSMHSFSHSQVKIELVKYKFIKFKGSLFAEYSW